MSERNEKLAREAAKQTAYDACTPMCPSIYEQIVERHIKLIAPLLDAREREARLEEAKWWQGDGNTAFHAHSWDDRVERLAELEKQP